MTYTFRSSSTAIEAIRPKRSSSGPSTSPIESSGTRVASASHTLPDSVRTMVVSPMVSMTVSGALPWEFVSGPQAASRAAAMAMVAVFGMVPFLLRVSGSELLDGTDANERHRDLVKVQPSRDMYGQRDIV